MGRAGSIWGSVLAVAPISASRRSLREMDLALGTSATCSGKIGPILSERQGLRLARRRQSDGRRAGLQVSERLEARESRRRPAAVAAAAAAALAVELEIADGPFAVWQMARHGAALALSLEGRGRRIGLNSASSSKQSANKGLSLLHSMLQVCFAAQSAALTSDTCCPRGKASSNLRTRAQGTEFVRRLIALVLSPFDI